MKERIRLDQVPSELPCEIKELILEDLYILDPRWDGCLAKLTITGMGITCLDDSVHSHSKESGLKESGKTLDKVAHLGSAPGGQMRNCTRGLMRFVLDRMLMGRPDSGPGDHPKWRGVLETPVIR